MHIQLLIVSEQTLANFIPLRIETADLVYLFSSKNMAANATHLAHLIAQHCPNTRTEICSDMPDANLNQIQDFLLEHAARIQAEHPDAHFTVNTTGGNKLMSMGLVEVWRNDAHKMIYTDTQHRRIEVLPSPKNHHPEPILMGNQLDVPVYLTAQKINYKGALSDLADWQTRIAARKSICKEMGQKIGELTALMSDFNRITRHALATEYVNGKKTEVLVQAQQTLSAHPFGEALVLMKMLVSAELISWQRGDKTVTFTNLDSVRFLSGGWLEEYAYHILHDEKLFDVRMSVNVANKQSKNEFDVLACHHNQLLFIECKTLRFNAENDNEIAYKVDSLGQDARGLFGQTWLLSARKPTQILLDRTAHARIKLIGPDQLPKLREIVREWQAGKA